MGRPRVRLASRTRAPAQATPTRLPRWGRRRPAPCRHRRWIGRAACCDARCSRGRQVCLDAFRKYTGVVGFPPMKRRDFLNVAPFAAGGLVANGIDADFIAGSPAYAQAPFADEKSKLKI